MLERLLELIRENDTLTPGILAQKLNTSPAMVEAMLEDLSRRGLLCDVSVDLSCSGEACAGCTLSGTCKATQARIWAVK
jgi:Mn-dependent DtxR family transcriptional regulator